MSFHLVQLLPPDHSKNIVQCLLLQHTTNCPFSSLNVWHRLYMRQLCHWEGRSSYWSTRALTSLHGKKETTHQRRTEPHAVCCCKPWSVWPISFSMLRSPHRKQKTYCHMSCKSMRIITIPELSSKNWLSKLSGVFHKSVMSCKERLARIQAASVHPKCLTRMFSRNVLQTGCDINHCPSKRHLIRKCLITCLSRIFYK